MGAFNQILSNIYVINTGGHWLTSNSISNGSFLDFKIANAGLYASDSTGAFELCFESDTSTAIIHLAVKTPAGGYEESHYGEPIRVSERLYVKTLTAGTGYLYFV